MSRIKSFQLVLCLFFGVILTAVMIVGAHKIVVVDGSVKLRPPIPDQPLTGIQKVSLGMTLDQVTQAYPDFETLNARVYVAKEDLEILFDTRGDVRSIAVNCSEDKGLKELASVYCGETIHELSYVYGNRLNRYCDLRGPTGELYVIDDSSLAYRLWDGRVVDLIVKNPDWLPRGYKKCRRPLRGFSNSVT